MSRDMEKVVTLLERILSELEQVNAQKRSPKSKHTDDERAALAVVAIAKGASNLTEVASELRISRATAGRNPGVRRALETMVRDRKAVDSESAEDFRWHR